MKTRQPLAFASTLCASFMVASIAPAGDAIVVGRYSDSISRYDWDTGAAAASTFVPSGQNGLEAPQDMVLGPDRRVYVASAGQILRYEQDGTFIDVFVDTQEGGLTGPSGLAFGPGNHLLVADSPGEVLRFDGVSGAPLPAAGQTGAIFIPTNIISLGPGLALAPDGTLLVGSCAQNTILRYNGTTGAFVGVFAPAGNGLNCPMSLTFGPDDNVYVANFSSNSVLRLNGTSGALIDTFVPPGAGGIEDLVQARFGPDEDLYVTSRYTNEILRFDGVLGTPLGAFVQADAGGIDGPSAIVWLSSGSIAFEMDAADIGENAGTASLTLTRRLGASGTFVVDYAVSGGTATAGEDFQGPTGSVTFADGELTKTLEIAITDDNADEDDETIEITLSTTVPGGSIGAGTTVVTIIDDDIAGEGGGGGGEPSEGGGPNEGGRPNEGGGPSEGGAPEGGGNGNGGSGSDSSDGGEGDGCSCRTTSGSGDSGGWFALGALALALVAARRRKEGAR